jgi:putative ABC transport system substrate-binding protein
MVRIAIAVVSVLLAILGVAARARAANIAVFISSDADEYKEALKGFKEAAGQHAVTVFDMYGDLDKGRKALAEVERKGKPDLIFAIGTWALQVTAAQADIPVVYAMVLNPPSVVAPNAKNVTGASMNVPVDQSLRVLKQLGPKVRRIGVIFNRARTGYLVRQAEGVAREEGLQLVSKEITSPKDVGAALDALQDEVDALWIVPDETILAQAVVQQILLVSYRKKLPVLGLSERHARMGALLAMSFASSEDIGRQAGESARAVLSGKAAGQIPYTTARHVSVAVNLKAAEKLGIEIPKPILTRATVVIQ